jgi:N-acetyl-anhydromuramyl-L-alanine amidase AmpD
MAEDTFANKGDKKEDKKQEKPPEGDAASHYLVLADGRHVGYQVDTEPYAPFPTEYDGVAVISVHNAR